MTKIILHGGFTREDNELNRAYYREITKSLKDSDTVLVVLFAREKEEWADLLQDETRKLAASTGARLKIELASENNFMEQVKQASAIVIRGGDTLKLIEIIKQYPDFAEAIKGKVVAGSSAGAYLFSKYYHSGSEDKVFEGLGILPIRIICHYDSKKFETRGNPLEKLKQYPENLELVILKDYEWRVFEV
ncbi:MAG TPA: Type 1 glutamine amidotransferase-like domain-containing protein [Candidatus Paceibacterota bacterium]|nr:Type 1 glutamine amidotransferase-like domain-containing protein [Candidatus Paceibacterota bacterium]